MNCRICNRECKELFQLDNQPAGAQHLPTTPDSKGITLHVVQCTGCGLVQLDNEPVSYWKEVIRSSRLSKKVSEYVASVDSFNELEHQPNPNEWLKELYDNMKLPASIITVPNSEDMRQYDFIADHLMYFTMDTLLTALNINGFEVECLMEVLDKTTIEATIVRRPFIAVGDSFGWGDLWTSVHGKVGIYGAGHQAFAFLSFLEFPEDWITCVIDDNPDKIGKYTPATNLPIVGPEHLKELNAVIIMAGGYSDEILQRLQFDGSVAILRGDHIEIVK